MALPSSRPDGLAGLTRQARPGGARHREHDRVGLAGHVEPGRERPSQEPVDTGKQDVTTLRDPVVMAEISANVAEGEEEE